MINECFHALSRAGLVIGHTGHFPGGPTHFRGDIRFFIFYIYICQGPSCRDSEQPVAHWFVSCIDSVNTQSQCAIDGAMKYFAPPKERFTATSSSSAFPTFSQLYQEQACSAVSDAGQRARQEEERRAAESIKCLIGTRNRGRHLS